ncbi:MAG: phytoene desaturase family protein [Cyanobacteriota bacterium]|nr:phytoene desaturase family protein [Cyanobacteriota bacterium]
MGRKQAIVIGAGIGGLAMGIRLQSLGFDTTLVEKLDAPGGRAYVRHQEGFTFDMGPTVITVPHFIEELFALERDCADLTSPDFPAAIVDESKRITSGVSGGPHTSRYVKIVPILPFYRIYFDDGSYFDYDGDPDHTREQIQALGEPGDLEGYGQFEKAARAIFERGFLELGYTHFGTVGDMLKVAPDLLRLDAVRNLFRFSSRYFKSDKLRQVFSFETLLVGGNPLSVPAIYAMIHFVEKTWGIHFAMGGTGALVQGFVRKFQDLGGEIRYNAPVTQINVHRQGKQKLATGVTLADGTVLPADLVVSNADWANTYRQLIDPQYRFWNSNLRVKVTQQSMSLFVIYFGFRANGEEAEKLRHHTIILGPRYEELLRDIFGRKILAKDFSQYLHLPTLTDPSLAPPGHHAAYTLLPVPHNGSGLDWSQVGDRLVDTVFTFLEERGYLPDLKQRLVCHSYITPDYFEDHLSSYLGNAFGPEPLLVQSAFFRPHNRSEDIANLYLVGAGTQPGAGTPSVMMSAKMAARLVAEDFAIEPAIVGGQAQAELNYR